MASLMAFSSPAFTYSPWLKRPMSMGVGLLASQRRRELVWLVSYPAMVMSQGTARTRV